MSKTDERGPVTYRTEDHLGVVMQMYGSVWSKVLPYCIVNTLLVVIIVIINNQWGIDLSFSDKGHKTMGSLVSFLLVSRAKISNARYMESRKLISDIVKSCRELAQHTITFTRYEHSPLAKEWRADVARRTIILLRTVVSVLQYETKGIHAWQVPELTVDEQQALRVALGEANERSPMVLAIFLRTAIAKHVECLEKDLDVNQELKLLECTADFVRAYHGLMKLITTPFPFPLVQMTRTFLFFWVFTLPCALLNDMDLVISMFMAFFTTHCFVGLEFVSIELDDPFGEDPNDFDVKALAEVAYADFYVSVHDIDGREAADTLRNAVHKPLRQELRTQMLSTNTRVSIWNTRYLDREQEDFCDDSNAEFVPKKKQMSKLLSMGDIQNMIALEKQQKSSRKQMVPLFDEDQMQAIDEIQDGQV
eukprot:CAMPEP_0195527226 /NCGR_PEP_ID=MMETSP0794_2-20130614/28755_1 /TAXON_ID=515487 /ORGANISM="Stephanopyxis turris, Strain CCMP 815" /LENGTH=420 /DNA_ID=CAMNT_0040658091 /DNA_START=126 /DNA_END=1388 /DNA_ORIENTATION=+